MVRASAASGERTSVVPFAFAGCNGCKDGSCSSHRQELSAKALSATTIPNIPDEKSMKLIDEALKITNKRLQDLEGISGYDKLRERLNKRLKLQMEEYKDFQLINLYLYQYLFFFLLNYKNPN